MKRSRPKLSKRERSQMSSNYKNIWFHYENMVGAIGSGSSRPLVLNDYHELLTASLYDLRSTEQVTRNEVVHSISSKKEINIFIDNCFAISPKYQIIEVDPYIFIVDSENLSWLTIKSRDNIKFEFNLYGSQDNILDFKTMIGDNLIIDSNIYIEWVYNQHGESVEVPLTDKPTPTSKMYPFLNGETPEAYFDRFYKSNASILLLIGPPGTGKTTFITSFIKHTNSKTIISYDPAILSHDAIFVDFISKDHNLLVLEDADTFLGARTEGNTMMHRFLNVGDGLVSSKNKKIIFSTNLPNLNDIDPAIIRPGRCFDILKFDYLTQKEADAIAKDNNIKLGKQEKWTIAEIFFGVNNRQELLDESKSNKIGFQV